ncbi:hypothetical protein FHS18_001176 [Paenibacillus phyllosphaerae]|uniref:Uncharacterized protein n=1 Tax=Paenibacillus phyllosphaerae TaxID=274593 RepID=A0A7W5FLL7_9BACL|nr:hypothetical protein [Paenibacillus phyllosphaerae]MBB3109124.1 hypothetical protein [Paenibacillus phyllosphaerae]
MKRKAFCFSDEYLDNAIRENGFSPKIENTSIYQLVQKIKQDIDVSLLINLEVAEAQVREAYNDAQLPYLRYMASVTWTMKAFALLSTDN